MNVLNRITLILLLMILISPASLAGQSVYSSDADEEAGVRAAIQHYIDGAATADASHFEAAFLVPGADVKAVWTNSETGEVHYRETEIEDAIASWTRNPPEESWGRIVDINIVSDHVAHVALELLWRGTIYVDMMALYKVDGTWKIVSKTYVSTGRVEN